MEQLGVLLIHGFTADHHGMRPIAEIAEELGLAVEMPLLRGHGLTYRDLRGVCWDDWVADVSQALAALKQRAERVIIAGFSLDGLLALATAAQHEDLDSIVALAPALRIA
ncbi:MAG TPA: alpha/beta fold hydrolase, partial [Herpetosiphonaceae bacterium]|nr:alpha/beta fold hydrolase [Herpetosiphonaceae bacterium]